MTQATVPESRNVLDYQVVVRGLFGRNRTAKFAMFKVRRADAGAFVDLADLLPLMESKLAEIKFKSGYVAVKEYPVELRNGFETFVLMSERTLHEERR
jgi:hypothetical protein